jgi:hypothetical protein
MWRCDVSGGRLCGGRRVVGVSGLGTMDEATIEVRELKEEHRIEFRPFVRVPLERGSDFRRACEDMSGKTQRLPPKTHDPRDSQICDLPSDPWPLVYDILYEV